MQAPKTYRTTWQHGQPLPESGTLDDAAFFITQLVGPVSGRSLERWPLRTWQFNGRVVVDISHAIELAKQKRDASPVVVRQGA